TPRGHRMTTFDLGPALLFVPADRPERYAKALERADAIIIDLEDAVAAQNRPAARESLAKHLAAMDDASAARTVVRINPVDEHDFLEDVALLSNTAVRHVMVPKVESYQGVDDVAKALEGVGLIVLCETAAGVLEAARIAQHPAVTALMWGSED